MKLLRIDRNPFLYKAIFEHKPDAMDDCLTHTTFIK